MSIRGVGVDIVGVSRFERILARHGERFVSRICRAGEVRTTIPSQRAQHIAGLFAAKEAVLKALGTGWDRGLGFRQVEVVRDEGGRPGIRLHDNAATAMSDLGGHQIHISITHDGGIAAAIAVLEGGS